MAKFSMFGGLQSGQAAGLGMQMMQDVMKQNAEKQKFAFEKQKFNLQDAIAKQQMKIQDIQFKQGQEEIKQQKEYFDKLGQLLEGLYDPEGNINKDVANKIMVLQGSYTGKVGQGLAALMKLQEKVVGNRIMRGTEVVGELPKTQRELEAEAEKKAKETEAKAKEIREKAEKEAKEAKKTYDQKLKDRKRELTANLKAKGDLDDWGPRRIEDAAKKQLAEETFRTKRGYLPIRGLGSTEPKGLFGNIGAFTKNVFTTNPFTHYQQIPGLNNEQKEFIDYLMNDPKNKGKYTLNEAQSLAAQIE